MSYGLSRNLSAARLTLWPVQVSRRASTALSGRCSLFSWAVIIALQLAIG